MYTFKRKLQSVKVHVIAFWSYDRSRKLWCKHFFRWQTWGCWCPHVKRNQNQYQRHRTEKMPPASVHCRIRGQWGWGYIHCVNPRAAPSSYAPWLTHT